MKWIDKDGNIAPEIIEVDGFDVINPTEEHYRRAGYMPCVDPLPSEAECLKCAKEAKIREIEEYDSSDAVNSLTVNGVKIWYDQTKRIAYMNSVDSAITCKMTTINLPLGDKVVPVEVEKAKMMLALLQLYADDAFITTEHHKAAVMALESEAEVKAYDYKTGYPDKLDFTIK